MLAAEGVGEIGLFFTHAHYDHVMGLPFFKPLYDPGARIDFWSGHAPEGPGTKAMAAEFMRRPFFPVGPEVFRAACTFHDFRAGEVLEPRPGLRLVTAPLNHPGGATGYRVEWQGRAVAVVTDTEHEPGTLDPAALKLMQGADLALYDAAYEDHELSACRGFGHSTWQQAIRLAQAAGTRRVGFIHHMPLRTDAELARIGRAAQAMLRGAFVARDGMRIAL